MTAEEAIDNLKYLISDDCTDNHFDYVDEIEMAIEALEKQIELEKAMKFIEGYAFKDEKRVYTNGSMLVSLLRVKQAIEDKAYNGFYEG